MKGNSIDTDAIGTIDGPTVFLKLDTEGDNTRGADNLFHYFTTRKEKVRLGPYSNR